MTKTKTTQLTRSPSISSLVDECRMSRYEQECFLAASGVDVAAYERDLRSRLHEAVADLKHADRTVMTFARVKIKELEEELRGVKAELNDLSGQLARTPESAYLTRGCILELFIAKRRAEIKVLEGRIVRFRLLYTSCKLKRLPKGVEDDDPLWRLPSPAAFQGNEDTIADIKASVPPETLLGTPVRTYGGRKLYRCPVHKEKSASFYWFEKNKTYHCFGCQAHGSIIDLFMALNDVDFVAALTALKSYL